MLDTGVHVWRGEIPIRGAGDTVCVIAVVFAVSYAGGELSVVACLDGDESRAGGGDGGFTVGF